MKQNSDHTQNISSNLPDQRTENSEQRQTDRKKEKERKRNGKGIRRLKGNEAIDSGYYLMFMSVSLIQ